MTATYYILDVEMVLTAPDSLLGAFDLIYGRFRDPAACGLESTDSRTRIATDVERAGEGWTVSTPWGEMRCAEDALLTRLLFVIQNHVIKSVRSVVAVHGASLIVGGRGCILAAPSATGKTTMAVELVRRGAGFLSDEIAALSLTEPVQHAFPRAIALRENGLELLGLDPGTHQRVLRAQGENTIVVDPDSIASGCVGVSTVPGAVFFLAPPDAPPGDLDPGLDYLEVAILEASSTGVEPLAEIEGVEIVTALAGRPYSTARIGFASGLRITEEVDRVLTETGTIVCGHHRGASSPIDYAASPALYPLSCREGILRLVPAAMNMRGLAESTPPQKVLFQLTRLLDGVRFYRLTPGRLAETADVVERTCREACITA